MKMLLQKLRLQSTSNAQFDYSTGKMVNLQDANGTISSYRYDVLDRPTQFDDAVNIPNLRNQTTFDYEDENNKIITTSDLNTYGDCLIKSESLYDGIGRTVETRKYETSTQYVTTLQHYDGLGRTTEVSNPFRPGTTPVWTRTTFDSLGRVATMTTPDDPDQSKATPLNSKRILAYSGNLIQVTDQDGKSRRTETDALGRTISVVEFTRQLPNPGVLENPVSSDYITNYKYDTLDNLRMVDQGGQQRFFAYDSLGRIIRAKNPEQDNLTEDQYFASVVDASSGISNGNWSLAYKYDENGNLVRRKDARNISAVYTYDNLNRNTKISYEGETGTPTPDTVTLYDGAVNGKGRLYAVISAGTAATTVEKYDGLGRITRQRQNYWVNNQWGTTFATERTYNLAGNILTQTYPSGNKVSYQYDSSGRLADFDGQPAFKGNLGDGQQRTYASSILYDAFGNTNQERFGTDIPVYDKRFYNQRGQLAELRVGTTAFPDTGWNRGAILNVYTPSPADGWTSSGTNNNGNLRKQMMYIPKGDNPQADGWSQFTQYYGYDQLNRLKSVEEKLGDNTKLNVVQAYDYDRWGNRTINAGATSDTVNKMQFSVNAQNRLVVPSGQSGSMRYDGAGNLINDTYTGGGKRSYDAENRMTIAKMTADPTDTAIYTYDGSGQRVKRNVGTSSEVWQVYGIGGELLAEYAANANWLNPQKEYGYRNGKLLITATGTGGNSLEAYKASTQFSSTQGQGQWFYQTWNGSGYSDMTWDSQNNVWSGPELYLWVFSNGQHPGTSNDAVRKWVAPRAGTIKIKGQVSKANTGGGDGVNVKILHNSALLFDKNIAYNDATGYTVDLTRTVAKDDVLYFRLNRLGDTYYDSTNWDPVIEYQAAGGNNPEVYKASTQFSSIGGQGQWFYQTWNGSAYTDMTWDSQNSVWSGPEQYLWVWNNGQHPGSNKDSVRKWVAPHAGTIKIKGQVSKANTGGGDGVNAKVLLNSTSLFDKDIAYNDTTGYTVDLTVTVAKNDALYFRLNRRGETSYDSTNWDPVIEYQATANASGGDTQWLITDQLGNPRMIVDKTGSLAGVTRQDFLPFGEELTAGRSAQQGYTVQNNTRQKFTGYERDGETGLDYAQARYYSNTSGRFTSVDPLLASGKPTNPQSWNRYAYVSNNPMKFVDPTGMLGCPANQTCPDQQPQSNPQPSTPQITNWNFDLWSEVTVGEPARLVNSCAFAPCMAMVAGNQQTIRVDLDQAAEDKAQPYGLAMANDILSAMTSVNSIEMFSEVKRVETQGNEGSGTLSISPNLGGKTNAQSQQEHITPSAIMIDLTNKLQNQSGALLNELRPLSSPLAGFNGSQNLGTTLTSGGNSYASSTVQTVKRLAYERAAREFREITGKDPSAIFKKMF